jgi:8-oxo-dGTP diphosphatase
MTEKRPTVGVGVVVIRDGVALVGLRRSGIEPGTWGLPGGHLAFGETWQSCAERELREETGLELVTCRPVGTTETFAPDGSSHEITIFLEAHARGELRNPAPSETVRWDWHPWDALPTPRVRSLEALLKTGYMPAPNEGPAAPPAR